MQFHNHSQEAEGDTSSESSQPQEGKKKAKSKIPWKADEDDVLLRFVGNGKKSMKWSRIARLLNFGRTGKQCRERYHNHLRPEIRKGDWTPEEDRILVEMKSKFGNQWATIAKNLPGRSDNTIKNRWHLIIRGKNSDAISLERVDQLLHANSPSSSSVVPTTAASDSPPAAVVDDAGDSSSSSGAQIEESFSNGVDSENSEDGDGDTVVVPETSSTIIVDCSTLNITPTDNSLLDGNEPYVEPPSVAQESDFDFNLLFLFHSHHENDHKAILTGSSDMVISTSILFLTEEDAAAGVNLPSTCSVLTEEASATFLDCYRSELDDCSQEKSAAILPEDTLYQSFDLTSSQPTHGKGSYMQQQQHHHLQLGEKKSEQRIYQQMRKISSSSSSCSSESPGHQHPSTSGLARHRSSSLSLSCPKRNQWSDDINMLINESCSPLFSFSKTCSSTSLLSQMMVGASTDTHDHLRNSTTIEPENNINNDHHSSSSSTSGNAGNSNEQVETCVTTTSLEEFDSTNRAEHVKNILGSSLEQVNGFVCNPDLFGEDERRLHSFLDGRELQELYIKVPRDKLMMMLAEEIKTISPRCTPRSPGLQLLKRLRPSGDGDT